MKKLITIISFLCFLANLFAQQEPEIKLDSMLANIDKTVLTNNILYDRAYSWSNLDVFNDSINVSNTKHFEQALTELYKASNQEKFQTYKSLKNLYTHRTVYHKVDLGIINASFHQLNYNQDEQKSALKITNNIFEKINNDKAPFIQKEVLIISPLKQYVTGNDIIYHFNDAFLLQNNTNHNIDNIVANFDTNTDYTIYQNGNFTQTDLSINYTETGYKTLTFLVTFNDNSIKTTQATIHVKRLTQTNQTTPCVTELKTFNTSQITTTMWNGNDWGYNNVPIIEGQLQYKVFYAQNNTNCKILKPIIFVDGFDPFDARKISDEDPRENLTDDEHHSIEEFMTFYSDIDEEIHIIDKLQELGYDVIIVNQPVYERNGITIDGGADYIERNGFNHIAFYKFINQKLAENNSTEQLVIAGPSMGGQITRFALAYMEKKFVETGLAEWQHNCRLWVSVDSPHLGANIPMGIQSLLHTLKNVTDNNGADLFVDLFLGSAAAKQQLIEQYNQQYITFPIIGETPVSNGPLNTDYLNAKTISQGFTEDRGHPFFIQYYNNLFNNGLSNSNGYPQNLRKIAIVNGSLASSNEFDSPYNPEKVLVTNPNWPYNDFYKYDIQPIGGGITIPYQFANNSELSLKIKGLANHIGVITSMSSYFMPNSGNNSEISFFKKKRTFGFNHCTRTILNNNSRGGLDNLPGGWFDAQRLVASSVLGEFPYETIIGSGSSNNWLNWGVSVNSWEIVDLDYVSSFIPTVSALGFKNPDFNWHNDINRNLVCTSETPFDNFYAPSKNEQHTSFTKESFNWFKEELNADNVIGPFPVPTNYVTENDLIGSSTICAGETETYYFEDCKVSENVNWTTHPYLDVISSTSNSITVTPNQSFQLYWVRAELENGTLITKRINSLSQAQIFIEDSGSSQKIWLGGIDFYDELIWVVISSTGQAYLDPSYHSAFARGYQDGWTLYGKVIVTNSCGSKTLYFHAKDPCPNFLQKTEANKYQIKDCNNIIVPIDNSELYNTMGIKEQDLIPVDGEIEINNSQSGTIKIIKAVDIDGNTKVKRIIID